VIALHDVLDLLPAAKRKNARLDAFYSLTWLPLAASAAAIKATVTTQDDSDFIAMRLVAYTTDTATPPVENTTPQATLTLQIGSNQLMPDATGLHIGMLSASAAYRTAYEFSYPIWIARQTTLTGFLTNLTATAWNVRIHLEGIRIMNQPG
jgi:hypothetical protein